MIVYYLNYSNTAGAHLVVKYGIFNTHICLSLVHILDHFTLSKGTTVLRGGSFLSNNSSNYVGTLLLHPSPYNGREIHHFFIYFYRNGDPGRSFAF